MRLLEATLEAGSSNLAYHAANQGARLLFGKTSVQGHLVSEIQHTTTKPLPSHCVCGKTFSIDNALSCPKGEFISLRHNELQPKYLMNATQL